MTALKGCATEGLKGSATALKGCATEGLKGCATEGPEWATAPAAARSASKSAVAQSASKSAVAQSSKSAVAQGFSPVASKLPVAQGFSPVAQSASKSAAAQFASKSAVAQSASKSPVAQSASKSPVAQGFSPVEKIRVLQVCDHLGWEGSRMHGVKRLFAWMIPRFDPERFEVSLVSLRKKDLSEETLDALGIDITYLQKGKFDPSTLPALVKIIDRKRIDVLHLHGYGATTFGRMAAAMRGIPAILHEHANLTDTPWFQKVADRLLERYTDIAIAVSKSTAEFVVHARLVRPEKVKVVYLGAPHEEFSRSRSAEEITAARRQLGIEPGDFAVGTVTRLHDSKGNSYLVDAARLVLNERPDARFFLAGEGPLREPLEARARTLGLGDRFVFVGFARDVAAVLSAFDLSVFPSLWEGTPLTAFEALASAKPIVATDADGLLDILTNGRDARIVPRRDAPALATAIVELMNRPGERARLSAAARETAQRYDITAFVRKMEHLYVLLCDESRESRPGQRRQPLRADLSFLA